MVSGQETVFCWIPVQPWLAQLLLLKPISYRIGYQGWNQLLTQLRFIQNWVIIDIQWMVRWGCWFTVAENRGGGALISARELVENHGKASTQYSDPLPKTLVSILFLYFFLSFFLSSTSFAVFTSNKLK